MSTITTTAPSFEAPRTSGRRILVAGAVVAGLVVAGAVAIPRLATQTASPSYPAVSPHDAVEHRLDVGRAAAAGAAARQQSERVQRRLDLEAKHLVASGAAQANAPTASQAQLQPGFTRAYVGGQLVTVEVPRLVERSVVQEQTGQIGHYAWTPSHATSVQKEQTGQQGHYSYVPQNGRRITGSKGFPSAAIQSSTTQQQVGGAHATYAYSGSSLHLTWTDPWVPPTDNPEWVPYIKSHYFHPVTTRDAPTHEYR